MLCPSLETKKIIGYESMGTLIVLTIFILVWWILYKIFTPGGSPRSLFLRGKSTSIPKEERKRKLNIQKEVELP